MAPVAACAKKQGCGRSFFVILSAERCDIMRDFHVTIDDQIPSDSEAPDPVPANRIENQTPASVISKPFRSVLFPSSASETVCEKSEPPDFFKDLSLDRIVQEVIVGWREYDLARFFYAGPCDMRTIAYRQQVMKDIEDDHLMRAIQSFTSEMKRMRALLSQIKDNNYRYQGERFLLSAAVIYCQAVAALKRDIAEINLGSRGMRAFRRFLDEYAASDPFNELVKDASTLQDEISAIHYCLFIKDDSITVRDYDSEEDYNAVIERTFEKFRGGEARNYRVRNQHESGMNHIQEQVVIQIARLHPETFRKLETFFRKHADFPEDTIVRFDEEVQFYLSYLAHIRQFQNTGLAFCYPRLTRKSKEIECRGAFDLALADKLLREKKKIVTNDFFLRGAERIAVVSGPNHGGKTTFARTIGQILYLSSLGLPVPSESARLFLPDRIFTHFEREEDISTLRGKLADDLMRMRRIFDQSTPSSVVIINEIFSSATEKDAIYLGRRVLERVSALDMICVCVTFLDELASFNEKTVSMVSMVDPDNPAIRTYKLVRKPADGLAYAIAIAEKHHLTYKWLKNRIQA